MIKGHIEGGRKVQDSLDYLSLFNHRIEAGFDFFFNEYYALLCLYANKIIDDKFVAEEIASDSLVNTWRTQNIFQSINNLKSFLFVAAKYGAISFLRRRKGIAVHVDTFLTTTVWTTKSHEESLITAECFALLMQALETLPPQCKLVCKRLFVEGQKTSEIAEGLGLSKSTIKSHKANGIVLIKKMLLKGAST